MKVGIVTFHRAANYGAVLQAYALQEFLSSAGHSPFLVDHHYGIVPGVIRRCVGLTPKDTFARWASFRRQAVFADFRRSNLVLSERPYRSERDLDENPPTADVYVCGSDQIWNPDFLRLRKDERAFFLDFGEDAVRRIAYAASLGLRSIPPEWSDRFRQHLTRFDLVSVREETAVPMLAKLGRSDATWAPDPTLLLTADAYERRLNLAVDKKNLVFSYILDRLVPPWIAQTRRRVCDVLSLPYIETYPRSSLQILRLGVLDPRHWLSMLKTSRFVVTNSFHGVIFSLIFRRPFIALPLEGKSAGMNVRIESLLGRVGLENRLVTRFEARHVAALCVNPVDWDRVGERIREYAAMGSEFLSKALTASVRTSPSRNPCLQRG